MEEIIEELGGVKRGVRGTNVMLLARYHPHNSPFTPLLPLITHSQSMLFYLSVECSTADAQFFGYEREVAAVLLDGFGYG